MPSRFQGGAVRRKTQMGVRGDCLWRTMSLISEPDSFQTLRFHVNGNGRAIMTRESPVLTTGILFAILEPTAISPNISAQARL